MKQFFKLIALAAMVAAAVGCDAPAPAPTPSLYPAPTPDTHFEVIEDICFVEPMGWPEGTSKPFSDCGRCKELSITSCEKFARTNIEFTLGDESIDMSYYLWIESLTDVGISIMCPSYDYAAVPDLTYTYYQNKYMRFFARNSTTPPFTHRIEDLCIYISNQQFDKKAEAVFVIKAYSPHTGTYYTSPEVTMTYEEADNKIYPIFTCNN